MYEDLIVEEKTVAEFGYIDGRYLQLNELSEDDLCALLTALGGQDHRMAHEEQHARVEAMP